MAGILTGQQSGSSSGETGDAYVSNSFDVFAKGGIKSSEMLISEALRKASSSTTSHQLIMQRTQNILENIWGFSSQEHCKQVRHSAFLFVAGAAIPAVLYGRKVLENLFGAVDPASTYSLSPKTTAIIFGGSFVSALIAARIAVNADPMRYLPKPVFNGGGEGNRKILDRSKELVNQTLVNIAKGDPVDFGYQRDGMVKRLIGSCVRRFQHTPK